MLIKINALTIVTTISAIIVAPSHVVEGIVTATSCKDISSNSPDIRLKTHLFCDYDPEVRSVSSYRSSIGISVMPKIIRFDDTTNTLNVQTWTALNWTDPHLTWKPADFDGIDELHVLSKDIWTPDIAVHNSGDASKDESGFAGTTCSLSSDGSINCVPAVRYTAHCDSDYADFPFDLQSCAIELASWSYHSDQVSLSSSYEYSVEDLPIADDWRIVNYSVVEESRQFKMNESLDNNMYIMRFVLKRWSAGNRSVYVVPAFVLMLMTLLVLWLDCCSVERIAVACANLICHLFCIHDLYYKTPHNGATPPKILRLYEMSFGLMGWSVVLTLLLRQLRSSDAATPGWLSRPVCRALHSLQLDRLDRLDPVASGTSASEHQSRHEPATWHHLGLCLGRLALGAALVAYALLFALYLPSSSAPSSVQLL